MRPARLVVLLAVVVASCALVVEPSRAASSVPFRVIVNSSNATTIVERRFLAEAFLKKTTRWADGSVIRPVDLDAGSGVRRRFSEDVLGRSVSAVKNYWQQVVFSGRDLPPAELDTDEEIIQYVVKHEGAVGYVSGNANVDRVKTLTMK